MTQQTGDTTLDSVAEGVINVDGKGQARFRVLRYGQGSFARYFLERMDDYLWAGGVAQEYGADDLVQIMASLLDAPSSGAEEATDAAEAVARSRHIKARALAQTYGSDAEPALASALALLSAVTEDDGGARLDCSLCSWETLGGFTASSVAEVAAEGGWLIGANGRAVCPTCLLEATVP